MLWLLIVKSIITFKFHSTSQALVKSASGTFLPSGNSNWAVSPSETHVVLTVLYGPFKETLARFARKYSVMKTAYLISANWTRAEKKKKQFLVKKEKLELNLTDMYIRYSFA